MLVESQERPWPLGPFLSEAREKRGMSKAVLVRPAGISPAKVAQLEKGYSVQAGVRVPVGTTRGTLESVARALEVDVNQSLVLTGFVPDMPETGRVDLAHVQDIELIAEVERRLAMRGRRRPRRPGRMFSTGADRPATRRW